MNKQDKKVTQRGRQKTAQVNDNATSTDQASKSHVEETVSRVNLLESTSSAQSLVEGQLTALTNCCDDSQEATGNAGCCGGQSQGSDSAGCCFGPAGLDENGEVNPGYLEEKRRYLARIRRIEGQVRGIHRMVDEEQYCIDVLTQISAVNSALRSLALGLLDEHLHHCVLNAANSGPGELDAKLAEASAAIARLAK